MYKINGRDHKTVNTSILCKDNNNKNNDYIYTKPIDIFISSYQNALKSVKSSA